MTSNAGGEAIRWYNRLAAWSWDLIGQAWVDLAIPVWNEDSVENREQHQAEEDSRRDYELGQAYEEGRRDEYEESFAQGERK